MKRLGIFLSIVLALAVVGSAGYLGTRSVQSETIPAAQVPTTVEVTRGDVQQTVTAPGQLVGTCQVALTLDVSGKLVEVHVRPGERVQAGDVLARIDRSPLAEKVAAAQADLEVTQAQLVHLQAGPSEAEMASAQLALAQAEADVNRLRAGPTTAEIATAEADMAAAQRDLATLQSKPDPDSVTQVRAELERAEVVLQQAQAAYDQVKDRPDVGLTPQARDLQEATIAHRVAQAAFAAADRPATPAELKAAQARLDSAQAALAQLRDGPSDDELHVAEMQKAKAEAELAQLGAGPTAADVKQAWAAVQAAELALEQAQADLAAATLTAPFDGVVLEVKTQPGETVAAGASLVVLADPVAVEVETSIIEEDLPLVQPGQEAELFFDARPDAEVLGHVARIVPQRLPGDRPLYAVYITTDDLPEGLLAGMTVDASIIVASRRNVLRLPRTLVRARTDGAATIQIWSGSRSEERLVHTGLRGDVYIEILDGLREGEQVVAQ